jgi:orotate phosphoribosyltransferase
MESLPLDYDLIVGIPRSGMLVANLLALHMNLPISYVDGFLDGIIVVGGPRMKTPTALDGDRKWNVFVVDDSVDSGGQISRVREKLMALSSIHRIQYGAVYATNQGREFVDTYYQRLEQPRFFEWNLFHHGLLSQMCMDIDGVLCRDPSPEENDDGPLYTRFLETVPPKIVPTKKIGWLVTCRLEKYRMLTEQWLRKQGIQYGHLVMMNYATKEERMAAASYATFKANIYQETKAMLFVESSLSQARDIVRLSGCPVWCAETRTMITPRGVSMGVYKTKEQFQYKIKPMLMKLENQVYNILKKCKLR